MKKSKQKKENTASKSKRVAFSKKDALRVKEILLETIISNL